MKEVPVCGKRTFRDESEGKEATGGNVEGEGEGNDNQGGIGGVGDKLSASSSHISAILGWRG